jgi:hypothetical protein
MMNAFSALLEARNPPPSRKRRHRYRLPTTLPHGQSATACPCPGILSRQHRSRQARHQLPAAPPFLANST